MSIKLHMVPLSGSPIYLDLAGVLRVGRSGAPFLEVVQALEWGESPSTIGEDFNLDHLEMDEIIYHWSNTRPELQAYLTAWERARNRLDSKAISRRTRGEKLLVALGVVVFFASLGLLAGWLVSFCVEGGW